MVLSVVFHFHFSLFEFYWTAKENLDYLVKWLSENQPLTDQLLNQHRAILFRGFGAATPADFDRLVVASGYK